MINRIINKHVVGWQRLIIVNIISMLNRCSNMISETIYICINFQSSRMKAITTFLIFVFCFTVEVIQAKAPDFKLHQPDIKPHRVIRTCCSFGTEMELFALPGIKLTETTSLEKIGPHHYLGDVAEGNGI